MKTFTLIFIATALIFNKSVAQPFIEYNGLLVMECESTTLNGNWTTGTTHSGYTGDSYIYYNAPINLDGNNTAQTISYTFVINTPGTYRFKIRNFISDDNETEFNDIFFRMDNEPTWKTFSHTNWQWNWDIRHDRSHLDFIEPDYDLTAGEHTLYIVGRSPDFGLDRIHAYLLGTPNQPNASLPESPRESGTTTLHAAPSPFNLVINTGDNTSVSPSNPSIGIYNPGTGTLSNVTATESSDWMDVSFSDNEGNEQQLDLILNSAANSLQEGTYTAIITFDADNAEPVVVEISMFVHDGCYYLDEFETLNEQFIGGQQEFALTAENGILKINSTGHSEWDFLAFEFNNGINAYDVDVTPVGSTPVIKFQAKASSNALIRATVEDANMVEAQNTTLGSLNNFEITTSWQTFSINLSGHMWDAYNGGGALDETQLSKIRFRINPGYTSYPHEGTNATYNTAFSGTIEISFLGFGNCSTNEVATVSKNKFSQEEAIVYPNPFNKEFILDLQKKSVVEIYSISGQKLKTTNFNAGQHIIGSELNTGIYLLKVINTNGTTSNCRIIKN